MKQKTLIVIAGPTAVGKTSLSIDLAQHYHCPIISFDSRQFYREMSIGTAKPNAEELSQAEHHFINSHTIKERYTAGMYETEALAKLDELFQTHDICIAVGGSGLYINALCYGIDDIPADDKIRAELKDQWEREGLEVLQEEVLKVDPEFYHASDMKNPRRVMRALEVYKITGLPYSSFRNNKPKTRPFQSYWIGLNSDIQELYERINQRVDVMVDEGLIEEVEGLFPQRECKALKTVGYQELFDFFEGNIDQEKAIELIKRNSRHYAKRQITWFKKNQDVNWFTLDEKEKMLEKINEIIS